MSRLTLSKELLSNKADDRREHRRHSIRVSSSRKVAGPSSPDRQEVPTDTLPKAFRRTGLSKDEFQITEWTKTKHGKSVPVEWRGRRSAEVSMDIGHEINGPDVPHVGWQGPGKGAPSGHIFVDEVPANR